ncbi:hypothetical protein ACLOJK_010518 [Asimina triloba]
MAVEAFGAGAGGPHKLTSQEIPTAYERGTRGYSTDAYVTVEAIVDERGRVKVTGLEPWKTGMYTLADQQPEAAFGSREADALQLQPHSPYSCITGRSHVTLHRFAGHHCLLSNKSKKLQG